MPAASEPLPLADGFPVAGRDEWRKLVTAVLTKSGGLRAGEDPELALSSRTYDPVDIRPLYTAVGAPPPAAPPGQAPFVRGATPEGAAAIGWDVRQRHVDPDAKRTNAAVLDDLVNGATSVWLVVGEGGLDPDDLPVALDGVHLDLAPVALEAGANTAAAADTLLGLAARAGVRSDLAGTLGADPIGLRARTGAEADLELLGRLAAAARPHPRLHIATVDGSVYADAGGSDSDEIAATAAVGVAYLRALTDAGIAIDRALGLLEFRYAVGTDQFLGIAKLRAARRVWDRVAELSGAAEGRRGQRQHAVTSPAVFTRRDPWVNMLRATIGCFAAAVGGADAITVLPFDTALGRPDDFARRIARNTQAILHDESSLARVVDAAGGSWYVESLTEALAERSWEKFTAIERAGGALRALDDGALGDLLATARADRAADIAHRRAPITGVSEFAFVGEEPVTRPSGPSAPTGGPLPAERYAEPFERLRDRADAVAERPRVFLAAIGPAAATTARLGFAGNLFQAAGIEPVVGSGDPDAVAEELRAAGTPLACLCSSDRIYAESADAVARSLREAGAAQVWLAGRPGTAAEVIDAFVFAGCDALAVLDTALSVLGVA